jgi:aconitate hydratase
MKTLPYTIRIVKENLARFGGDTSCTDRWLDHLGAIEEEIEFMPHRVLMQDFTGVPAIVDLASMRQEAARLGHLPSSINPKCKLDLVIDHSITINDYGNKDALDKNIADEMQQNRERYEFLKWGQSAFSNFRVVPPGTVNLEYLADVVVEENGVAFPDTCIGTDSHTTMINGLGVLGWGVGGIEAESVMLGQPISMLLPKVVGVKLTGRLNNFITATDLVLTITQMLRAHGVVNKFVEFYGEGAKSLSLADRATIANMAPEYGATCGFFAIDERTIEYLTLTGRKNTALIESYAKANGLWLDDSEPTYSENLSLDLSTITPSVAGPKRPQDRLELNEIASNFTATYGVSPSEGLGDGAIVIAAITSCTNTSNPSVMIAAGLVAKKAVELGLKVPEYVKTSLAPGSQVVAEYLEKAGLQKYLDTLGFNIAGFGCTTCIGNSGALRPAFEEKIKTAKYTVSSVLSGNRNFEGRVHPLVAANYLMSPPLVVLYALAGNITKDVRYDLMPSHEEVAKVMQEFITPQIFSDKYSDVFRGTKAWEQVKAAKGELYEFDNSSTYIQNPPFFEGEFKAADIKAARILAIFGDSITTDHISPAGNIAEYSPAGLYLKQCGVAKKDFNSYGARRGNHEVMMRGTFANIRIKNTMMGGSEGGYTYYKKLCKTNDSELFASCLATAKPEDLIILSSNECYVRESIYDVAMKHKADGTPLVVFAGKEYGTGSSRDWAAKGTMLLGIKAVVAKSFERIHRSNLVGMGVYPLEVGGDYPVVSGGEVIDIIIGDITPKKTVEILVDGKTYKATLRIDTENEIAYFKNGGLMRNVIKGL